MDKRCIWEHFQPTNGLPYARTFELTCRAEKVAKISEVVRGQVERIVLCGGAWAE